MEIKTFQFVKIKQFVQKFCLFGGIFRLKFKKYIIFEISSLKFAETQIFVQKKIFKIFKIFKKKIFKIFKILKKKSLKSLKKKSLKSKKMLYVIIFELEFQKPWSYLKSCLPN